MKEKMCPCGDPVYYRPNSRIGKLCYICTKAKEAMRNLDKIKKADRKRLRDVKEKIKTTREHLTEAQRAFNTWIRKRDEGKPCISCGTPLRGKFDAGHYMSAGGNSAIRFNEDNCHGQCVECNHHLSGNLIHYRRGLIARIGEEKVDFLELNAKITKRWTVDELKSIKEKYKTKPIN
jgi:hypothetical protein